jgi:hypothetical protein
VSARNSIRRDPREAGIALLISIFILLLISVVAISLLVSSGTESAIAGNYRAATAVYYAALAGLEEGRGRLSPKDPNSFKSTAPPGFLPAPGAPFAVGSPVYIINSVGVAPWDPTSTYPDNEFQSEFPSATYPMPNPAPNVNSVSNAGGIQGPSFKWVRVNGVSEQSLNINFDGNPNSTAPVYYDGARFTNNPSSGNQVVEVTSLAVLPNGSQKMVQYLVASVPITLPPFLAALTLSGSQGSDPVFQAPTTNAVYAVKGDGDQDCNGNPLPSKVAVGLYGSYQGVGNLQNAINQLKNGIPSFPPPSTAAKSNYTGQGAWPDVEPLTPPFQTPSQLDSIVQTIVQNADVIIPSGPVTYPLPTLTGSALTPLGMSSTNPLTVVVNGNLNISNWSNDGYGLLLVTGTFTYDPDTNWYGIILVIGQGAVNNVEHGQYKQINGAMFVAQTRDSSGNLLPDPNLGGASVTFDPPMHGNGIRYSSCWIQKAQPTSSYKILSFHEIAQ